MEACRRKCQQSARLCSSWGDGMAVLLAVLLPGCHSCRDRERAKAKRREVGVERGRAKGNQRAAAFTPCVAM